MKRESYERARVTLTAFLAEDVIATSVTKDEYEDDLLRAPAPVGDSLRQNS